MIERHWVEGERCFLGEQLIPGHDARRSGTAQARNENGPRCGRKTSGDLLEGTPTIERFASVGVAIDREQHLRRNLAEAIEHALDTEFR